MKPTDVRRRVCRENGDVIGGVSQRRKQVRAVRGTAAEIVWLVNDCHSVTTKSNLGKSVLDGVVTRAGTNTIATDCTSQRNTQYNHFSYPVYNSDCNIEIRLQSKTYQSYYQPILLVEEHRYYSSREDILSCSSS